MARPMIGQRRRRFVLEVPLESPDGFGGVIRVYQPGPQVWGAIALLKEAERRLADRPEAAISHRVVLAFRDGVAAPMRLSCGLRRFAIRAASDPDGRRRDLVCLVEEIQP
jgi:SPP1 family predicted phage head-tail adaptor